MYVTQEISKRTHLKNDQIYLLTEQSGFNSHIFPVLHYLKGQQSNCTLDPILKSITFTPAEICMCIFRCRTFSFLALDPSVAADPSLARSSVITIRVVMETPYSNTDDLLLYLQARLVTATHGFPQITLFSPLNFISGNPQPPCSILTPARPPMFTISRSPSLPSCYLNSSSSLICFHLHNNSALPDSTYRR